MATKTYDEGYTTNPNDNLQRKVTATANETDTAWSLTSIKIYAQKGSYTDISVRLELASKTGSTQMLNVYGTPSECGFTTEGNYWVRTITHTLNITKSKTESIWYQIRADIELGNKSVAWTPVHISIPKKTSYAITYNANGGSGAPSSQTKWHDESLTLTSTKPVRAGYQFNMWNTSQNGTGASYSPNATYTNNVATTLYAQWKSAAKAPTISSLTVIRCNSSGTQDDNGTYCKITVVWSVDTTSAGMAANTGTVTGQIKDGQSTSSITFSGNRTGTGGTATALLSGKSLDKQYIIDVTVTNSKIGTGQSERLSTTRTDILTKAKFVMDFRSGGNAIGIGVAAPQSGLEIGWDTAFDEDVDIAKTLGVTGNVTFGGTLGVAGNLSANNYKLTSTTVLANIVTLESGWTCSTAEAYKFGRLCQVYLRLTTTAARTAGSAVTVGTFANGWKPITYAPIGCGNGGGVVSTSGSISYVPARAMNANTLIIMAFVFMSNS